VFLARSEPGTARYTAGPGWPGLLPQAGHGPPPQPGRPPGPARKKGCGPLLARNSPATYIMRKKSNPNSLISPLSQTSAAAPQALTLTLPFPHFPISLPRARARPPPSRSADSRLPHGGGRRAARRRPPPRPHDAKVGEVAYSPALPLLLQGRRCGSPLSSPLRPVWWCPPSPWPAQRRLAPPHPTAARPPCLRLLPPIPTLTIPLRILTRP
jgi:hypothetical protein